MNTVTGTPCAHCCAFPGHATTCPVHVDHLKSLGYETPGNNALRAWTETIDGPGIPLYVVCIELPAPASKVLTHRPLKSLKQAKALERDMHGWTGSVVLTTGWTVRP